MSATKFTPGPWIVQWAHGTECPLCIHNGRVNVVTKMGRRADPETVRNACLIAAAPDLYAALRALISPDGKGVYGTTQLIDAAVAALAKATPEPR